MFLQSGILCPAYQRIDIWVVLVTGREEKKKKV